MKYSNYRISVLCIILIALFFTFNSCNSLSVATYKGKFDKVQRLVKQGENVNEYDRWGWTPLMWAAYYNHFSIVKFLLEKNADPNLKSKKAYGGMYKGSTPLMMAAYNGHVANIKILLDQGADKNILDKMGNKAFTYAEQHGNEDIMNLLKGK